MVTALCELKPAIETQIKFDKARDNFYSAARFGLRAQLSWRDQQVHAVHELIERELLPLAESGLMQLGVAKDDCETYLAIIAARVRTGMNGANWQRAFVAKHDADMTALTAAYMERQESGEPVHEWTI
jgi:gamma-glutamyl:cysteine ligase YbdK (ATP-grasp superfamily)